MSKMTIRTPDVGGTATVCQLKLHFRNLTLTYLAKMPNNSRLESRYTKREFYATLLLSNFQVRRHSETGRCMHWLRPAACTHPDEVYESSEPRGCSTG